MIEPIQKILIIGPESAKESLLADLQKAGIVQVEPYLGTEFTRDGRPVQSVKADHALQTVRTLDKYAKTAADEKIKVDASLAPRNASEISELLPKLEEELKTLKEKHQHLINKKESIEAWGSFDLCLLEEIRNKGNISIQFWELPHKFSDQAKLDDELAVLTVAHDAERSYFLTFAKEPVEIPNCLEIDYNEDLSSLNKRIHDNLAAQDAIKARIYACVSSRDAVLRIYLKEMDLLAATAAVSGSVTMFEGMVFVVQAWVPASNLKKVNEIAASYPSRIEKIEPSPGERVPTLMANTGAAALGEDLVKIYDTPSFQDWDPSSWVFFSFVIFYSMIFADAGYALTIIAILLYAKHKVKDPSPALARFFNLSLILSAGTLAWGLLTGGFYGLSGSNPVMGWITKIALIDTDISHEGVLGTMMQLSIFIGMGHITISLILKALRYAKSMKNYLLGITNAAWIVCIWAFYFWAATKDDPAAANIASVAGTVVLVTMVIVFLTSAPFTFNPLKWFFGGFMGIYNGVQFFADVLSYLRIFALGLSGTLIAQNFNNLAQMVWDGMGWIGIIPAALIFVAGHALNIALGIMGGVIHGLRLNFLEWYRWCFDGGGRPYKAFKNLLSEDKA